MSAQSGFRPLKEHEEERYGPAFPGRTGTPHQGIESALANENAGPQREPA
ncbi:hypothetical protein Sinac_0681 [Singulisphaera acidiphila DSM 18658]|uniref:Uncharacterized protein n=1 Tax=Singulisphaera acidiphila (strain ATCC BAA-1392 / DSM 18658 / VKM B-2454 / MOB10) TaxID=886293 RepID=L0D8C9_SINAD|nr:hypothetical protein Sinac_0681 [Singulisphaera acidiphila DSM 18658]